MNKILSMIALCLMTTVAWADGTVTSVGFGSHPAEFSQKFNSINKMIGSNFPTISIPLTAGQTTIPLKHGATLYVTKFRTGDIFTKIQIKCKDVHKTLNAEACSRAMMTTAMAINPELDEQKFLEANHLALQSGVGNYRQAGVDYTIRAAFKAKTMSMTIESIEPITVKPIDTDLEAEGLTDTLKVIPQ